MKYRKKPVVIEAIEWTGDNFNEVGEFTEWRCGWSVPPNLKIETLEGWMIVAVGDMVIKGVNGEFYPCKPDIFEKTYEMVGESE